MTIQKSVLQRYYTITFFFGIFNFLVFFLSFEKFFQFMYTEYTRGRLSALNSLEYGKSTMFLVLGQGVCTQTRFKILDTLFPPWTFILEFCRTQLNLMKIASAKLNFAQINIQGGAVRQDDVCAATTSMVHHSTWVSIHWKFPF